jgi:hypothetical protein
LQAARRRLTNAITLREFLLRGVGGGSILIELEHGRRIRVDDDFDAEALGRAIDVLDRRR